MNTTRLAVLNACSNLVEVAHMVSSYGVKGVRGDGYTCPISMALKDDQRNILTVQNSVIYTTEDGAAGAYLLSEGVKAFIKAFDVGYFPHLEVKSSAEALAIWREKINQ